MEKLNHSIGNGVSRLSPKFRNIQFKSMTKEELYFQVKRKPSQCRFQQISNKFNFSFEFIDVFVTLQFAVSHLGWGQIDEHDVTVDHTMLSRVAKLSNLRCSTMYDNVY